MNKKELRLQIKRRFQNYSREALEDKSESLAKNLSHLLTQLNSEHNFSTLGVFSPLSDEPIWWRGFEGAYEFLLVHMKNEMELSFHPVALDLIKSLNGALRIPQEYLIKQKTPDVLIVPGLGFTKTCERLGRGKGYYDRYLETFEGLSIGVGFSFQEVDQVFGEEHDQNLDYLVTDKKVYMKEK